MNVLANYCDLCACDVASMQIHQADLSSQSTSHLKHFFEENAYEIYKELTTKTDTFRSHLDAGNETPGHCMTAVLATVCH